MHELMTARLLYVTGMNETSSRVLCVEEDIGGLPRAAKAVGSTRSACGKGPDNLLTRGQC